MLSIYMSIFVHAINIVYRPVKDYIKLTFLKMEPFLSFNIDILVIY